MAESFLNRLEQRITALSARNYPVTPFSFEQFLVVLSRLYGLVVGIRGRLFKKRILGSKRLPCYVISIGNIVAGGSGKTPMAIYLAELVKAMGFKPVVVSRGYRGKLESKGGIVGTGDQVLLGPDDAGDEPFMMAGRCSFPVVVGKDRYQAGLAAINAFDPDVIILDDGFQHLKLQRDLNVVLVDAKHPLGNGRLLPAGRLRESPRVIQERGDLIVFTRCDKHSQESTGDMGESILPLIAGKPVFRTCHTSYLSCYKGAGRDSENRGETLERLSGKTALLFSGISDNPGFKTSVENIGVSVKAHLEFRDHHLYKSEDITRIHGIALEKGVEVLITTEKDYARLDKDLAWRLDLAVIGIEIELLGDNMGFKEHIRKGLE
ncbi:MAG: tetraacyldisaccharide 4'-kinase [Desulfobacterium sp.]|nr:tetraacyldisaccharide 4'-kinase [Desulfobacterium sp.]